MISSTDSKRVTLAPNEELAGSVNTAAPVKLRDRISSITSFAESPYLASSSSISKISVA